jgi:GNAT superfamily N-acetyltransferase
MASGSPVTGRRRGERISDLVLSSASGEEPAWSDFTHVTLVGPTSDALFPDDARDVTAGMLCEHEGLLFVFFSWNTGVYYLSLDLTAPGWRETIAAATGWKDIDADPFPRPTPIKHSRIGDGRLFDALPDRKARIVLCRDRFLAPGGGWEVVDGEDGIALVLDKGEMQTQDSFLFPSFDFAQFGFANGNFYLVGQQAIGTAPVIGLFGGEVATLQLPGTYQLAMPHLADRGYALATPVGEAPPANLKPLAILWSSASDVETHEINGIAPNQFPVPVILGDKPAILLADRDAAGHASPIAYESRLTVGATTAAAVVDREGLLEFRRLPVRPIRMQPVGRTVVSYHPSASQLGLIVLQIAIQWLQETIDDDEIRSSTRPATGQPLMVRLDPESKQRCGRRGTAAHQRQRLRPHRHRATGATRSGRGARPDDSSQPGRATRLLESASDAPQTDCRPEETGPPDARPPVNGVTFPDGLQLRPLQRSHPRRTFDCGQPQVNDWLRTKALQHQAKRLSVTGAAIDSDGTIAGFYTLATGQVDFSDLPAELVRQLPRRALPVAVLAWLGVSRSHQGRGLGDLLFAQALRDCHEAGRTFAFVAVILDCLDDRTKSFYQRWDFTELPGHPYRLFLSGTTLAAMMGET